MSDKSFGDYANRNIVKNPLLSTAVTGLSIEDLTHNAVLVPVAPNQGQITRPDTGTYAQTLAHTDHEHPSFPSGDSNSNMLLTQTPVSSYSHTLDSQTSHHIDKKTESQTTSVSKASTKTEDDFDVNEYFARLQGTRYVSAPLHSHPDPNANLTETEENLEEINLNDDKTLEVQQSLTADIAQNFSQLPNVLPHVASAVFSSFSNMWSMKSREQTPDERAQSYHDVQFEGNQTSKQFQHIQGSQKYQDVQFQGTPELNQFTSQGLGSNVSSVPLLKTEDVVKEVAPPPKEPPICGTSNFRLPTRKKYAQIPGLSTGATQQIAFNPLTQNVPSYFIPSEDSFKATEENKETERVEHPSNIREQIPKDNNENYNIFTPVHNTTTAASDSQPNFFMPVDKHPPLPEETLSPINLQNQIPDIPPPPMFSTQRRENPTGKSILPPSVARRIGSNHPVIKKQIVQPPPTDNIFVPTFDPMPTSEPKIPPDNSVVPTYGRQTFTSNINQPTPETSAWPTNLPPQQSLTDPSLAPPINFPPRSSIPFPSQSNSNATKNALPTDKTASHIFEPADQMITPAIFTPFISDSTSNLVSPPSSSGLAPSLPGSTSLPHSTNIFTPLLSTAQTAPVFSSERTIDSYSSHTDLSSSDITTTKDNLPSQPPKALVEPPKVIGSSNFRMIKKRPQYYAGPIEGIGSISNSIKPVIPTVDSGTFHGALFTPEQLQSDTNTPSFDISNQSETTYSHFGVTNLASNLSMPSSVNQESTYSNYNVTQPFYEHGQHYNTPFDLKMSTVENREPKEELKESKGFGIIGSLKSKLSNIDINKIQSSVTTFFDPGYNTSKKDDLVTQENMPYYPSQYHSQPQSNVEIFVPNIEQSMQYSSSDQDYKNMYSQVSYDNSIQYNYQHQSSQFMDPNYSHQAYSTNYYPDQPGTQHLGSIFSQDNTTEIKDSCGIQSESNISNIQPTNLIKNINTSQSDASAIDQTANIRAVEPTASFENFFQTDSNLLPTDAKQEENTNNLETKSMPVIKSSIFEPESSITTDETFNKLSGIIPCPGEYKDNTLDSSSFGTLQSTTDPRTVFETSKDCKFYPNTNNMTYESFPLETKSIFDDKVKLHMSGYSAQDMGSMPIPAHDNIKTEVKSGISLHKAHDVRDKVGNPIQDNLLLQSLSKEEVPILGVSSVPLFGLSTIVPDKVKDSDEYSHGISLPLYERVINKDIMNQNASISFFENLGTIEQKTEEHDSFSIDNALDENRILGFLDDTLESKDEGHGLKISSTSFFTNDPVPEKYNDANKNDVIVDRNINIFENIGAVPKTDRLAINKETVLTREKTVGYVKVITISEDIENVSELNICETCREVNKPEEKDIERDDLTMQLIENITSPIQLSNPVEVPLTEDNSAERVEFDAEQFEEISHITEETIETIHVQSATELLEADDIKTINYGWKTEENFPPNPLKHSDYTYQVDPNIIGFFGDSQRNEKVPTNASDELKAEFKHQDVVLPRQMSIPSAPPAEEDSKSDEGGVLDVNSIELDAKEDFPIYEEFVIEPSETDDDKIEFKEREKTEDSTFDSFTNRVEKFKKMEESDVEENKLAPKFQEVHNQPISMASYFDTGNYAADTHYRNTLNSPSHITIPPGFEEEFRKKLALAKEKEHTTKLVPDTTTQTKFITSVTTAQSIMPVGFNVINVSKTVKTDTLYEEPHSFPIYEPIDLLKQSSEVFEDIKKDTALSESKLQTAPAFASGDTQIPEASSLFPSSAIEMPKASSIFGYQGLIPETSNIFVPSDPKISEAASLFPPNTSIIADDRNTENKIPAPILSDPMNFFADTTAPPPSDNVNRLASYFSSPPKTDHAKSFFELSQSQNHYKHSTSSQKYEELIKDLTSVQNLAVPTDQTIRHVNYFTVEYDVALPEFHKGDALIDSDDKDLECLKYCSYCTTLIYDKRYKVKTSMNNNNEEERNTEPKMEATSNRPSNSVTVNFDGVPLNEETNEGQAVQSENRSSPEYAPVKHHWFYRVDVEDKSIWRGFSVQDSRALENTFLSPELNENTLVPTDGGRYDVNLMGRLRIPVYWSDKPTNVRRCSWFYKGTTDPRYVPYTESVAEKLEEEFWHGISTGIWHRRLVLPNGEVVVMHGPNVMVHFLHSDAFSSPPSSNPFSQLFSFGKRVYRNPPKIRVSNDQPLKIDHLVFLVHGAGEYRIQKEKDQSSSRPRVVRRGHDDSEIEDAEPSSIDHLLLLCHGVGSACDMRFRSVEEVVEDFRTTSLQLVQSHYKNSYDQGIVSRVEVLPISWHAALHSGEAGVDRRLSQITLDSIPRLRNFTNDTVLDVLFYTSPVFCQTILDTVCKELNRVYQLFKKRNPAFDGGVSLGGHSLGSVILYDLLCHQLGQNERLKSQLPGKNFVPGPASTGQASVLYPQLVFEPAALYALGSPIAIFECIRGVESLGSDFSLPTCKNFFNIFHPYDPIAYRIEPLINPRLKELKPYLIPHHKGRKRMHLELKDTMARVGADLKQKLVESLRNTWNKWKSVPVDGALERVDEEDMDREQLYDECREELAKEKELSTPEMLGRLNEGRRVDYVLQEAPLEMINEYLFAMSSHVGYWESEDTMLLMLREIYSALGVQPDSTVPQQSMSVQRTRILEGPSANVDGPSTSGSAP